MTVFDQKNAPLNKSDIYKILEPLSKNKKNGHWKELDGFGKVYEEGNYKDGLQVGEWKYYLNGSLSMVCNYIDGFREGAYERYEENKTIEKGNYLKSKKHGMCFEYFYFRDDEDCSFISKGEYYYGFRDGVWNEFVSYHDFKNVIYAEGNYTNSIKNGKWNYFKVTEGENILIKEERYFGKNTDLDEYVNTMVSFKEYYDSGQVKIEAECFGSYLTQRNLNYGELRYNENPILQKKISYYTNGNIESETKYELDDKEPFYKISKIIQYDEDGNITEEK